jgi:hypothetical protein
MMFNGYEDDSYDKSLSRRVKDLELLISDITREIEREETKITGKYRSCFSYDAPSRIKELCELIKKKLP